MPLTIQLANYGFFQYSKTQTFNNFNFNSCNFDVLNSIFDAVDWTGLFLGHMTSVCYEEFLETVLCICRDNIPTKNPKPYKIPWYTRGLKKLKNLRNKFHKRFINSGDTECQAKFLHYQREFNFLNKFLYKQFIIEKEQEIKSNPKAFWSFIKSKKQSSDIPVTVKFGNNISQSCNDAVNMFASFFNSNFEPPAVSNIAYSSTYTKLDIGYLVISEDEVSDAIFHIKDSFKCDVDGLCAHILKKCESTLKFALTYIFNLSLQEGVFVDRWKSAIITPVFKEGKRDDVTCYRPISKLSCISKLFEHVVYKKLFFLTKSWISPNQHGFFSGRSTVTNLTLFSEYCLNALECGSQVEAVFTDFSKAFDKLSHSILLSKLQQLGFHSNFLQWIKSYLFNRICKVVIEGFESKPYTQSSGVPQGSVLGPLLFNLFINDIAFCFKKSKFLLYADDLKVFLRTDSLRDVFDLQNDLNNLNEWCKLNNLHLNHDKCLHVSFYRSQHPITFVFNIDGFQLKTVKSKLDLGVVFDFAMTFVPHIEYIVPKAYKMLAFLRRFCSEFCDPYTLKYIYTSFVRSKLEYASVVWSPHVSTYISRIERVQRIFIKFAVRSLDYLEAVPYESKCLFIGLRSLEYRRIFQSALLIFDIINGNIDSPDLLALIPFYVPPRSLRMVDAFSVSIHRTNYARNGTLTRSLIILNNINLDLQKKSKSHIEFCTTKDNFKLFLFSALK